MVLKGKKNSFLFHNSLFNFSFSPLNEQSWVNYKYIADGGILSLLVLSLLIAYHVCYNKEYLFTLTANEDAVNQYRGD